MTTGFGFCANCGTARLAADQKFCAVCGATLQPAAVSAPVQMAPAPPPAPAPAPVIAVPAAEVPAFDEAVAAPAPDVEAAIPAPPAPEPSVSGAAAAPPPWATFAAPPVAEAAPIPAAPPVAPPPPPPAWSAPPPPPPAPAYQPAPPPVYQGAPTYQAPPPAYQPAPVAGTPAAARGGFKISPLILLVGVVLIAAIVGGYLYMNQSSGTNTITFTPSTVSCSKPVAFTATMHLPSSVKATDTVTITLNGVSVGKEQVSNITDMVHQSDGSWLSTSTTTVDQMQTGCAAGGSAGGVDILTPGNHTMQVLDSTGTKVLASGSYTVTP